MGVVFFSKMYIIQLFLHQEFTANKPECNMSRGHVDHLSEEFFALAIAASISVAFSDYTHPPTFKTRILNSDFQASSLRRVHVHCG